MLVTIITISTLAILVLVVYFVVTNLLHKVETYEDIIADYEEIIKNQQEYVKRVSEIVTESRTLIGQVDERGIFEADDDVGSFFRYLKEIQELLNNFIIIQNDGKSKE